MLFGQLLYAIVDGLVCAPMMTLLLPLFSTGTRYSGTALGWSISAAIFGGTALMVADLLVTQWGLAQGPGLYISLAAAVALWRMLHVPAKITIGKDFIQEPAIPQTTV